MCNLINTPVAHHKNTVIAKGDSGATNHYWRTEDAHVLVNRRKCSGPKVSFPNNETTTATEVGELPISNKLSKRAKEVMVLPELKSSSLISLGQLCDNNCNIFLG